MSDTLADARLIEAEPKTSVGVGQMIAYGTGGIIPIALFNVAGQLVGLIGNISLGLSAFWLGVIMILPRLWDAVSDPLVGHWSDRTRTRYGRRRPFLLAGGIAVALSFVMLWWVPQGGWIASLFATQGAFEWFQLVYILLTLLVFYTAVTMFEIPHGALGMEMTADPDGSTKLFSAKSFFGNIFATATPWLFVLANMELFRGTAGNEAHGMRYVSILVAAILIPAAIAWFVFVREPVQARVTEAEQDAQPKLLPSLKVTFRNRSFLRLVAIVFILALGFNVVGLLAYYIPIYYVFAGDKAAAAPLLGLNGTLWALTAIIAVVPLNLISARIGKMRTLQVAIGLMAAAQLTKIVCYNPDYPYLLFIPTVLLSAGMLFFFTLGPSILRDVCDEDQRRTGRRMEGTYYSVYWWFIKIGMAFASFATGLLITVSQFDEKQATGADRIVGVVRTIEIHDEAWAALTLGGDPAAAMAIAEETREDLARIAKDTGRRPPALDVLERALAQAEGAPPAALRDDARTADIALGLAEVDAFADLIRARADDEGHLHDHERALLAASEDVTAELRALGRAYDEGAVTADTAAVRMAAEALTKQAPATLAWLRILEIGLPLLLCVVSYGLTRNFAPSAPPPEPAA